MSDEDIPKEHLGLSDFLKLAPILPDWSGNTEDSMGQKERDLMVQIVRLEGERDKFRGLVEKIKLMVWEGCRCPNHVEFNKHICPCPAYRVRTYLAEAAASCQCDEAGDYGKCPKHGASREKL